MSFAAAVPSNTAGCRALVGRYRAGGIDRVLIGQRVDGIVHIYDEPRDGNGRRYFVEAGFESKAELAVLLADYRRQAARLNACPMSREAIERAFAAAALA